jgi:molybdenum cofactor guanylyltransferase
MFEAAAIVLAGGRSSRMGSPKAALEWHGSTLLRRVTGLVGRAVDGPVIVVGAPDQQLPALHQSVEVACDAEEGRGPMQGIATGLQAIGDRAAAAYVSSTDVPLLHPAFVRRVVGALNGEFDVVLPQIGGYRQPLAAAYRRELLDTIESLIAADRLRPDFLFDRCRVLRLDDDAMLRDGLLARADPGLESVSNLNEPSDYERARALPAPQIQVRRFGTLAPPSGPNLQTVRAWTLGELADRIGLMLGDQVIARLNGVQISRDPELPLVGGDAVGFTR